MADITAIILTKNESKNLPDCLESISKFAKRIAIIDSGSADDTVEIAKKFGADVYYHEFENYARQFNWALDNVNITTKWTLRLDADERFTEKLCEELEILLNKHSDGNINGITMEAWLYFMGKKIRFGGSKKRKLMVFKTGLGRIEDRKMDEHTVLTEGKSIEANEKFLHYDFKDINFFVNKMNWYATREMQDYFEINKRKNNIENNLIDSGITNTRKNKNIYYKFPMFIRSWLLFLYFYVFKLGFLDGKEGLIYHYLYQRWYRFLVDAKIYEQSQKGYVYEETGSLD